MRYRSAWRHGTPVRAGVLVAALLAALAVSACGGSSSNRPAAPAADAAVKIKDQLARQKTYAFETVIASVDGSGKTYLGEIHQKGVVQASPFASKLETTLMADGQPMGDASGAIFVNGKAYVRSGDSWAPLSEQDPDYRTELVQRDPRVLLVLLAASKDLHQTGQQTIDGTATTGYAGTFGADQFSSLPTDDPAVASLKDVYPASDASKTYTVQAWVDSSSLVRRVVLMWKTAPAGPAPALTTTATVNFSKFNDAVEITPPV